MKIYLPRSRVLSVSSNALSDDSRTKQEIANVLYVRLHEILMTIQMIDDQIERLDQALNSLGIKYRNQDITALREVLHSVEAHIYSIEIGIDIETEADTDD